MARARLLPRLVRRAAMVREPLAFALAELYPRPSVGAYTLRRSGLAFYARHHANDLGAFDDVVLAHEYAPPPPVGRWLAALPGGPRILDLGGHVGLFGLDVLDRFPSARITALEPDAESCSLYLRALERNGLSQAVEVVQGAATPRDGTVDFIGGLGVSSYLADGEDYFDDGGELRPATTVPGIDVLPLMMEADLVKMDIEGAEWAILGDSRAPAAAGPVIVLEFHDRFCPAENAEAAVTAWLERAGLYVWPRIRRHPGVGLVWAFDRALLDDAPPRRV